MSKEFNCVVGPLPMPASKINLCRCVGSPLNDGGISLGGYDASNHHHESRGGDDISRSIQEGFRVAASPITVATERLFCIGTDPKPYAIPQDTDATAALASSSG